MLPLFVNMITLKVKRGFVTHVISPFSRVLHLCRVRRTFYTMDGFCLLYLLLILLMRSGDVETNPGPNTAVSTISDMEFLKLAQDIAPSYYKAVGISLGIPHAQLQAILVENLKNYTNALLDVFMKWNVKKQPPHSNKRQLLADKLREIDLGGLSDELLNGPPIPNCTGGPSRLLESQTKPPSAESQTKPLSPEMVRRCAKDFEFKYRSSLCKIRTDPLNPASTVQFKDMYTNLFLQEEHGTEKRKLDYDDILDLKVNGEFPKRIMVQGEAGAGKTTFCAKIAWDWIEERHFSEFVWVLIVPLREFKQHTIGTIAKSYLAKNNPATISQITEYIRSNPDKIFIAFDGLDEVSGKIMKTESCESQPTDQMQLQPSQPSATSSEADGSSSEAADIGLEDILCSDQLASCPVLVTTRPWRAVEVRSDGDLVKLYTFIHVEGFNRENLEDYIHKYFPKNDDKANQLIQFISENDVLSENMAHYPIYVAMLCRMWKECDKQKLKVMKSLNTFAQIFDEMIAFLKEHYAQKKVKKVGSPSLHACLIQIDELLGPIAKQALSGLLENTLIYSEDDFRMCPDSKVTACRVGILSQEDRVIADVDTHERNSHVQLPVFFPHKLFQEYMAGVHLASLYESDHNEFNRLIKEVVMPRKEEFRYLLYFTVSQNKSIATHVMKSLLLELYKDRAESGELTNVDFIVDVAFESQDPDVAALVKDSVTSSEEIGLYIFRHMHMTAHTVAGYAFIGLHVVALCIQGDCGPTMSLDVAEIICSIPSLKEVDLDGALHHCFFETLARKGKEAKVQTLALDDVRCPTPASSKHLAEALCSMPNLTDLLLSSDRWNLNEEFYSTLKANASSIQVQTLKLNVTCPTPASSHHLVEALCSMPNLTDLVLGIDVNEEVYCTLKAKTSSIQLLYSANHDKSLSASKPKQLLTKDTSSMSVNEPSECEATPSRTETRDLQKTTEEIRAQYEFQADGRGGRAATSPPIHVGSQTTATFSPIHAGSQAAGVSTPSHVSSMSEQDFRGVLKYIANNMRTDEQTDDLGLELRIHQADIDGYKVENRHGIGYKGTHHMLMKWSMNQEPTEVLKILRQALDSERVKREDLYEKISSMPDVVDMGTTTTAEAQAAGVSTLSQTNLVSDRILDKLSRDVPHDTYTMLCTELDIGYNEAICILMRFNNNYPMATRDCLAQWKTRTGGDVAQLKTILVAAGVRNLVKYVN